MKIRNIVIMTAVSLILGGLNLQSAPPGKGNQGNPGVLPPQSHPNDRTYSQWAGAWWQWAYSFPSGANPVEDPTGELAGLGQSGPVWFLAGSFGATVTRQVTVPADKMLFVPIINTIWINIPSMGDNPWSDAQQEFALDYITPFVDNAFNLSCQIDGREVANLTQYRCQTSDDGEYMITFPENGLWGLPAGVYGPSVDDGIYLMLAPLRVGQHTIHFTAASEGSWAGSFALEVTYHLTVSPAAE